MKLKSQTTLLLIAVLLMPLGAAASAWNAQGPAGGQLIAPGELRAAPAKDEISLSEAVARVKREYGGRILEAETRGQNGRRVHVIKVLTKEGRVRTVRIPAGGNGGR